MSFKFLLATVLLFSIALAANAYSCKYDFGKVRGNITERTRRGKFIPYQGHGHGGGSNSNDKIQWCRRAETEASKFPELAGSKSIYYGGSWQNNYARRGIYIFGGYKESLTPDTPHIYSNDVYKYDISARAFSKVTTTGNKPSPKAFHVVSRRENKMVVALGGTFASDNSFFESFPEVHELNLETFQWTTINIAQNAWPQEFYAFSFETFSYTEFPVGIVASNGFVDGNTLYVFGGIRIGDFSFQNDFVNYWKLNLATGIWTTVENADNMPTPGYDRSCGYDDNKRIFHCYGGERIEFDPDTFEPVYVIPDPIQFQFVVSSQAFISLANVQYTDNTDVLTPRNTGNNMAIASSSSDSSSIALLYGGDIGGVPAGANCVDNSFAQNNVDDSWLYVSKNNGNKRWYYLQQQVSSGEGCGNSLPLNYKRGDSVGFTWYGERYVFLYGGWSYSLTCQQTFNRNGWVAKVSGFQ